jgi:mannose-6-phosphate isomerase-like protein (cupin superfamily)
MQGSIQQNEESRRMEARNHPTRRQVARALALAVAGGQQWVPILSAEEASTPATREVPMTDTTTSFHVVEHDDAEALWELGLLAFIKGDSDRTANTFCLVEFVEGPDFATPLHVHHTQDEVFYVLEGTMHGVCDDVEWFAHKGAYVWLPKGSIHGWAVYGGVPARTLAITMPGGFDKFVRETGEPAREMTLPPASVEVDPDLITSIAEKYDMTILGPPVNYLN